MSWRRASADDRGGRLRDAAVRLAGTNVTPEDGMVLGQGTRIGHGQPQAHEHAVLARADIVLERRAAVINNVIVQ